MINGIKSNNVLRALNLKEILDMKNSHWSKNSSGDVWKSRLNLTEKRTVELEEKFEEVTKILAQSPKETANIVTGGKKTGKDSPSGCW